MVYQYKGKKHDLSAPLKPIPVRAAKVFSTEACGERKGFFRHLRAGTPYCDACKAANRDHMREYYRARKLADA